LKLYFNLLKSTKTQKIILANKKAYKPNLYIYPIQQHIAKQLVQLINKKGVVECLQLIEDVQAGWIGAVKSAQSLKISRCGYFFNETTLSF